LKYLILYFWVFILCFSCSTQKKNINSFNPTEHSNFTIHSEFKSYFDDCGVNGSIVIFDKNNQNWILSDTLSVKNESLPASTFKIINLLIALETKTIKNENEIVKWVGATDTVKYGYRPEIYHEMTVKEAFEVSAGWEFIELAKKIGRNNYKKYLSKCNYGNLNLSQKETDFWNFGNFAISPINQVEFIKKLYEGNLSFASRNMEIVKKVMITEQNENYTIRAKTGWTRGNNINTGWWVGYLESKTGVYFFATRLIQDRKYNRNDFGACRKEITKKVFKEVKIIN
jgi:beta-lactamase class D